MEKPENEAEESQAQSMGEAVLLMGWDSEFSPPRTSSL